MLELELVRDPALAESPCQRQRVGREWFAWWDRWPGFTTWKEG